MRVWSKAKKKWEFLYASEIQISRFYELCNLTKFHISLLDSYGADRQQPKHLYIFYCKINDAFKTKVGISKNPIERFETLSSQNAFEIRIHHIFPFFSPRKTAYFIENHIKKHFASYASHNHTKEWFNLHPNFLRAYIENHDGVKLESKYLEDRWTLKQPMRRGHTLAKYQLYAEGMGITWDG